MASRAAAVFCLMLAALAAPAHAQQAKVLRYAFPIAETGFDPAQITDLYSRTVTPHIFDGLYRYDHLARPFKIKPNTAAAMPEVSDDFRVWTIKVQPGIYFQDDPAFKGQKRELTANDLRLFVQALLRSDAGSRRTTRGYRRKESAAWWRCATRH